VVAPVRASYPIADNVWVIALQDIATVFATPA
jgi:hypothetical protein